MQNESVEIRNQEKSEAEKDAEKGKARVEALMRMTEEEEEEQLEKWLAEVEEERGTLNGRIRCFRQKPAGVRAKRDWKRREAEQEWAQYSKNSTIDEVGNQLWEDIQGRFR